MQGCVFVMEHHDQTATQGQEQFDQHQKCAKILFIKEYGKITILIYVLPVIRFFTANISNAS